MQPPGAITRRFHAFCRHLEPLLSYRSIRPAAAPLRENQSRSGMLHQDQHLAYRAQSTNNRSFSLPNRKCDQDANFNFLSDKDDFTAMSNGGRGDENQNQERPCKLGPLGPSPTNSSSHKNSGVLSPRSRLPCWSTLDPLPEVEHGDDGYGRVPPDGAEERRLEVEEGQMMAKHREKMELPSSKSSISSRQEQEEMMRLENDDEWGDSESESGGSMSSLNLETGGDWMGGWDRIGVGEPKLSHQDFDTTRSSYREAAARRQSYGHKSMLGSQLENLLEEGAEDQPDQSTDSDGELPKLMDAMWTLRDRERFKAQEMEKHQVQLTMYRRLALIRWVRTLQGRIQEQQNRLQSSFDVILTHRKELLRMGAAAAVNTAPTTAVVQS